MLTIMSLAWQEACDRRWSSSVIFSALTEQRRNTDLVPGQVLTIACQNRRHRTDYLCHMLEVIVRDGRTGRDRTQDSAEGGAILATLQRDQPYEIGDVTTLADGDAVVIISDRQDIQPGQM